MASVGAVQNRKKGKMETGRADWAPVGFFVHDNRMLAERAFYCCAVVRPAVLLAQRTVLCDSFGKDCVKDKNGA